MSQAEAIRSTLMPRRVVQVEPARRREGAAVFGRRFGGAHGFLQLGKARLDGFAAVGAEKVQSGDLVEPAAGARDESGGFRGIASTRRASGGVGELGGQGGVVRVAVTAESLAEGPVGRGVGELGRADVGFPSAGDRLARDPLEVLEAVVAEGEHVDRVLQGHGAHAGQALADLGPQIQGLGRDLVDEEIPARRRRPGGRLSSALPWHVADISVAISICQLIASLHVGAASS